MKSDRQPAKAESSKEAQLSSSSSERRARQALGRSLRRCTELGIVAENNEGCAVGCQDTSASNGLRATPSVEGGLKGCEFEEAQRTSGGGARSSAKAAPARELSLELGGTLPASKALLVGTKEVPSGAGEGLSSREAERQCEDCAALPLV